MSVIWPPVLEVGSVTGPLVTCWTVSSVAWIPCWKAVSVTGPLLLEDCLCF